MIYIHEDSYGINVIAYNNISIGCANTSLIKDNKFYFNRLYVHPDFRNQGYATQMLNMLLSLFKEKGYILYLDINPYGDLNYEQLEGFYMKHGFTKILKHDTVIGDFYTYYFC